jgi:hypothetical protein
MPVFEIGRDVGNNDRKNVKCHIINRTAPAENSLKYRLYDPAEKVQRNHIKQQMHVILVQEPGCDKPIIFATRFHDIWTKNKPSHQFGLIEGIHAY